MQINPYLPEKDRQVLQNCVVGIAGAGGLGSNCAMHLIRSGVKKLVIADFDVVSTGNLNRQFFFADQVGRPKVDALRENLLRIASDISIVTHCEKVTADNVDEIFSSCTLLIEAFDRQEAKDMLIREMMRRDKTIIAASGIAGWGQSNEIRVRHVGKLLYLIGDLQTGVEFEGGMAPYSPRVGIAAAMQANTALALLLGGNI